jgi:signal transduction histidine kinase
MRLSKFILTNMEAILQEWEDFAKTIHATIHRMTAKELRDHAEAMLKAVAADLDTDQARQEGIDKSQGLAPAVPEDTAAEIHAVDRLASGFTIEQLTSEYRALRASVLRLWQDDIKNITAGEIKDMVRFNEAIDQSLAESVARYSAMHRDSQNLFLAILGHDVRSPLGAISVGAQMLTGSASLTPNAVKTASIIVDSSNRIAEIVSDLLDFSTSHLGDGIPVTTSSMDFSPVCTTIVEEMRLLHPDRPIKLEIAGDMEVTWDRSRISQAFGNLITNAFDHGSAESPIVVTVREHHDDEIIWTIQNAGEVISSAQLRTIFDPAKRFALRPASERKLSDKVNLGLGLYITREIIVAHGGRIEITSTKEDGTTFTIRLPRRGTSKNASSR